MDRLRNAVSVMAAVAVMTSCGKESGTGPVIEPPVSYSATILSPAGGATLAQSFDVFPNATVNFTGEGRDSKGGSVSTDFSWKLDGVTISSEPSFTKGVLPGNHSICLQVKSSPETCTPFTVADVKPITGRVYLAQSGPDGPITNLRAFAHKGSVSDSIDIDPSGTFSLKTRIALLDSVNVSIRCQNSPCDWFPSIVAVQRQDLARTQNFVVLSRQWEIKTGRWAGTSVPLSLEKGYAPSAEPSLKYFLRGQTSSGWYYQVHTWPKSALPIPVAFDRTGSNLTVTAEDSIFFWKAANELNAELGVQFFKPANERDLQINRSFGGTPIYQKGIGVWFSNTLDHAYGGYSGDNTRNIIGGVVMFHLTFGSPLMSQNQHRFVVKHELIHALGFGHNPHEAWVPGLMADYQYASDPLFGVAVKEDVAYQQAFYRVSELQKLWNAYGMPQIHQGERVFLFGFPLETLSPTSSSSSGASLLIQPEDMWQIVVP